MRYLYSNHKLPRALNIIDSEARTSKTKVIKYQYYGSVQENYNCMHRSGIRSFLQIIPHLHVGKMLALLLQPVLESLHIACKTITFYLESSLPYLKRTDACADRIHST